MAKKLCVPSAPYSRHILLCADQTKPKCASRNFTLTAWGRLKKRLRDLGLAEGPDCVFRTKANCLRVCRQGPIAVVYPDGVWYHSASGDVLDRIIEEHLRDGRPVEEYVFARNPLPESAGVIGPATAGTDPTQSS